MDLRKLTNRRNRRRLVVVIIAIIGIVIWTYYNCWWGGPSPVYDFQWCPGSCWLLNNTAANAAQGCGTCPGGEPCDCSAYSGGGSYCPPCPPVPTLCGAASDYACGGACPSGMECSYNPGFLPPEIFGNCICVTPEIAESSCFLEVTKYGYECSGYCGDGTYCDDFYEQEMHYCGCRSDVDSWVSYPPEEP